VTKAKQIFYDRMELDDGAIIEMKIWLVPTPVLPSKHNFKYSLFYGRKNQRIVSYDNERGKGDRKHILNKEEPYEFVSVQQLIIDFKADVKGNQT
jgi:hypothetical protein